MKRRLSKWIFSLGVFLGCLLVIEVVFTTLHYKGHVGPLPIWFIVEAESGQNYSFDPVTGYRLSPSPTEIGCYLTNGSLQTIGELKGNNYGFPDDRDFHPENSDSSLLRIAVFGDSYTASQFTATTWVEELENNIDLGTDSNIQFMNFSIDGGGLPNWWSIITRLLDPMGFQFDGVIFAVVGDDLKRTFHSRDDGMFSDVIAVSTRKRTCYGYSSFQNPITFPRSKEEQDCFFPIRQTVINEEELALIKAGKNKNMSEFYGEFRPYLSSSAFAFIKAVIRYSKQKAAVQPSVEPPPSEGFNSRLIASSSDIPLEDIDEVIEVSQFELSEEEDRKQLMFDIREYLEREGLPSLTVSYYPHKEIESFLEITGSSYFDASNAQNPKIHKGALKKWHIKIDRHWTQNGNVNFANYVESPVSDWILNNLQ